MSKWDYGEAYLRHPIGKGIAVFQDGSRLMTHNIFNPLPAYMKEADALFVDPPWNQGNMSSFYTKAKVNEPDQNYEAFYARLFECIGEISPKVCYLEIGKEYLADFQINLRKLFPRVTLYNSSYYHRKDNICYVVRGFQKGRRPKLDGMDEEDIINWVCSNENYTCIGDLCMGRGLVALGAYHAGRRFVGTELNHKRLSVALERLTEAGSEYSIEEAEESAQRKICYDKLFALIKSRDLAPTNWLRHNGLNPVTVNNMRKNEPVSTATIGRICELLDCQPGDILEYK